MNQQIKKNAISFDIDFENIKQDTITTKNTNKGKSPKKTEVIPNVEDPNEANKEQVLYQCPNCSRKFKREAYAKHVPICARVFQNKKEPEHPKIPEKKLEKPPSRQNKGMSSKPKWENQSNELRAIIQSKRAEKTNDKKKEIKIEIEEPKKHIDNNNKILGSPTNNNNNRPLYSRDNKGFLQCELCNKKFTKINFESHLNDCKQKYKDKKNGTFIRGNLGGSVMNNNMKNNLNNNANGSPVSRKPIMPAVTYGRNKPNFSVKFGKIRYIFLIKYTNFKEYYSIDN